MTEDIDLVIVMPVYNEEEAISLVLEDWVATIDRLNINYQIHVFNDGSKDSSHEKVHELSKKHKHVILHTDDNKGHGPTILSAYRGMADKCQWLFQIDSDNELKPDDFKNFWEKHDEYDFLIGHRVNRDSGFSRKILSQTASITTKLLCSCYLKDVNIPFRLMRTSAFSQYYSMIPDNTFAPNIIVSGIACKYKMRVYEAPVSYTKRSTGKVSIRHFKLMRAAVRSFMQTIIFFIKK